MAGSPKGQDIQGSCLLGFHDGCPLWLLVLESKGKKEEEGSGRCVVRDVVSSLSRGRL